MTDTFRGIYPILQTPFDASGTLLWDELTRQCDWVARSGAHGLVWPAMASEFTVISHPERVHGFRVVVEAVAGRIPVVAGVADTSQAGAVSLAEQAASAGADAIIAMPPWSTKLGTADLITAYYRALADAAQGPVIVQNCGAPLGSGLPATTVINLCREIPGVQYLKEEKPPQGSSIGEVLRLAGPEVKGVFGGSCCYWIIAEHRRGVCGNMPGAYLADVDARIWDLLEAGDVEHARLVHQDKMLVEDAVRALPLLQGMKEVLVRRGVFTSACERNAAHRTVDPEDADELDRALEVVSRHFSP